MACAAVVTMLETARAALDGTALEARPTASLARELHRSVPAQRPRARPLPERAIELARGRDGPATPAACLLARPDVYWTPGPAGERIGPARGIAELAAPTCDTERHGLAARPVRLPAGSHGPWVFPSTAGTLRNPDNTREQLRRTVAGTEWATRVPAPRRGAPGRRGPVRAGDHWTIPATNGCR